MRKVHREKVRRLVADLKARGINPWSAAPPIWHLAWLVGLELTPPHFMTHRALAWAMGAPFGAILGLLWGFNKRPETPWLIPAVAGAVAGVFFGRRMAAHYRDQAEGLRLPTWEEYPAA